MRKALRTACVGAVALVASSNAIHAGICDYRLSELIGGKATAAIGTAGGLTTVAGLGAKAAGYYLIIHSTSGAAMIGSTAAGASAAGTVGIIGGTAGVAGTAFGILTAPVTIAIGALTAIGLTAIEGGCYFQDETITSYLDVYAVVRKMAESSEAAPKTGDSAYLYLSGLGPDEAKLVIVISEHERQEYLVKNLYIVNGELRHRDWGPNTRIGSIVVATQ
ncbi:hypothetical protein [Gemmobacter nectariphilus]|uniref:hypothetical protein n=1 Tax=Gemmobacter nectariphilus TaxID=220343 RepID=UPI00054CDFD0|nr:hypothetical protein [Gemmobacter nectariphilus]